MNERSRFWLIALDAGKKKKKNGVKDHGVRDRATSEVLVQSHLRSQWKSMWVGERDTT